MLRREIGQYTLHACKVTSALMAISTYAILVHKMVAPSTVTSTTLLRDVTQIKT